MNALALLEFDSIARGVLAVDRMLKRAPIALLRCGTIHPGRYLVLCGGSVASTEEACRAASAAGEPCDSVLLCAPHPELSTALTANAARSPVDSALLPASGDLIVLETAGSPTLLRLLDQTLKAVPVSLGLLRLADDLGGRAYAILGGELADLESARSMVESSALTTIIARPDSELRAALVAATRFGLCPLRALATAENLREA